MSYLAVAAAQDFVRLARQYGIRAEYAPDLPPVGSWLIHPAGSATVVAALNITDSSRILEAFKTHIAHNTVARTSSTPPERTLY